MVWRNKAELIERFKQLTIKYLQLRLQCLNLSLGLKFRFRYKTCFKEKCLDSVGFNRLSGVLFWLKKQ
jgi:hypothetical protein